MANNKEVCVGGVIFSTAGILLLLGAAFDILPVSDNLAIFLGIACFIIAGAIKKIMKGGSCCK
ncbi:MAG: hypothetical protein WC301_01070 [Candidatus Omnitrophota bacterium]|jgi:hypothetical protein